MDRQQEINIFHARAGKAGDEFRKNTLAFSVGALGAFFISLTGGEASELSGAERSALLWALIAFAMATLSGLLAWFFAGRYFNKRAECGKDAAGTLHFFKNLFDVLLVFLFGVGVIASALYLWFGLCPGTSPLGWIIKPSSITCTWPLP